MVAAAKLRRAQSAAEAARPLRASAWARCSATSPRASSPVPRRRGSWPAPARTDVHLLVVCTAERGLCGAFNSSIARLARDHANRLLARGQDGQDHLRRQEGLRHPAAAVRARRSSTSSTCAASRQLGFEHADMVGAEDPRALRGRRVRRRDAVLLALPVGHRADPDGAADHPGRDRAPAARARWRGRLRVRARRERDPRRRLLPRNLTVQIFRALLENAASEQGARMSAMDNATRNAGEMIKKQTMLYNRSRQAHDHQGTDRNHLGRRGALTRHDNEERWLSSP